MDTNTPRSWRAKVLLLLRDPIWQSIGCLSAAIVAVIAILVSIVLFVTGQQYKALRIEILSNSPLISVDADLANEIEILYKGEHIVSLSLILLRLENTGTLEITPTDYSQPIRISLSPNAEVGEVSVEATRPQDIPLEIAVLQSNQIELSKVLLNPGDQAVIRILALNSDNTITVEGRIAGVRSIETVAVLQSEGTDRLVLPPNSATAVVLISQVVAFILVTATMIQYLRRLVGELAVFRKTAIRRTARRSRRHPSDDTS